MRTQFNISDEFRLWCPLCYGILVEAADGQWFCSKVRCDFVGSADDGLEAIA